MNNGPLAITTTGMVTGVGFDAQNSCAAIRATLDNFQETRFKDHAGNWLLGCQVPLKEGTCGSEKLVAMLTMAISECMASAKVSLSSTPLLICLPEIHRPGIPANQGNQIYFKTEQQLGCRFHTDSLVIKHGRAGGLIALEKARQLIYEHQHQQVIVAGVDSLLNARTLRHFEQQHQLLTSRNSDGFVPGEAAAALLVEKPVNNSRLVCLGIGFGQETATFDSEEPLQANGLKDAVSMALNQAQLSMTEIDFRIADMSGGQYWFKESALLLSKLLRVHKEGFPLWLPADCTGEVGAATAPLAISYLVNAFENDFSNGPRVLQHCSNDDGYRAAAVFQFGGTE
ncbi:beta-ketoacyl synthase N-terminal-like domain-containing protein [Bowmanella denitrificans]|uniref:beta-ketoacyl synthase N-terminal-like domain-containing protein n=1 Tax=Bowmanella denitrificans TaxID=366582 RepID=UPI000C9D1FF1|nr:beta-ketoacyl synthase N-terminal-like domain-containing protein [Bowmanella denitrificans]